MNDEIQKPDDTPPPDAGFIKAMHSIGISTIILVACLASVFIPGLCILIVVKYFNEKYLSLLFGGLFVIMFISAIPICLFLDFLRKRVRKNEEMKLRDPEREEDGWGESQ